ncbi:MAG TPA: PEGA domain-containing protein [Vicinamibacterales bacterium]|nr:PEGA domain-containing protein [Vicinamibacterales bacterium]
MLHQIGVGALGPVFRTYEPTRDRLVAVKVFRLDITPEQSQSLADELAGAAEAGLFHPSVVEPIASGMEGTLAYRAEEYVAAESLDVAMRHYAPAPIDKVLPFITQLAGAIDFARAAGVGHGALHPRDVFITPDEARATGFGVVEALERVGLRAPVRRPYSAPERVAGEPWSTAADVFSLAVITYEMLTGRRPAGTGAQIEPLTGPTGDALHAALAQAMDDDPARRFPTALSFISALEGAAVAFALPVALPGDPTSPDDDFEDDVDTLQDGGDDVDELEEEVDEVEDDVDDVRDVDAFDEAVVAESKEADLVDEEQVLDDIETERDDDDLHFALGRDERETEDATANLDLFDSEAIEDLALEEPVEPVTERFADEFGYAAIATEAPRRDDDDFDVSSDSFDAPLEQREPEEDDAALAVPAVIERPGPAMLPLALTLLVGLLIGAAGTYAVLQRDGGTETAVTTPSESETVPAATSRPRPEDGKAYSEQRVAPTRERPAARPPVGEPVVPAPRVPPKASAPAASNGRLIVRSTPEGAAVTIDGRWRGRTPLTLDNLALGAHVVRIVQPGFSVAREEVTLSPRAASRTLTFRLQRARGATAPAPSPEAPSASAAGSLYVVSRPSGARVFVDGKPAGVTPLRIPGVPGGAHSVRLELADHRAWTTTRRVSGGQEARVTASLDPIR